MKEFKLHILNIKQYSQVLLNEDENLKCLKSETKEKMRNNYLYRCYYLHSKNLLDTIGRQKYATYWSKSCVVYIIQQ